MSAQELLTVEQAASEFGVHRATLFRAIAEGRLPSHKTMGDRRTFLGRWDVQRLVDPPAVSQCLEIVYRHFAATGDWPVASKLQRELDQNRKDFDLLTALENLPRDLGWRVRDQEGRAQLTLRGIARCQDSGDDVRAFVTLVRTCYERYLGSDQDLTVTSAQLGEAFGFDQRMLDKLYRLVQIEAGFWSGLGASPDGTWSLTIDGDRIRHYRDVQSGSDYLLAKQRMFQPTPGPRISLFEVGSGIAAQPDQTLHPAIADAVRNLPDHAGTTAVLAAAAAFEGQMAALLGDGKRYGRDLARAFFDLAQRAAQPDPRRVEALRSMVMSALGAYRNPAAHGRLDVAGAQAREIVALFSLLAREVESLPLPLLEVNEILPYVLYREADVLTREAFAAAGHSVGALPSPVAAKLPESWFCEEHQDFIDRADLGLGQGEGVEPCPICSKVGCPGRGWQVVHPMQNVGSPTVGGRGHSPARVGSRLSRPNKR